MASNSDGWTDAPDDREGWVEVPLNQEEQALYSAGQVTPEGAALHGAGQGFFGAGDEIAAAAKTAYSKLAGNDKTPWVELYNKKAAEERKAVEEARKQQPYPFYGGMAATTLGTLAVPGLNVARGASLAQGVKTAAALGVLQGAGLSENTVTDNPIGLAKDSLKGGAIGGAAQGAFSKIGSMLSNRFSPTALKKTAEERAVKAAVGNNATAWNKIAGVTHNSAGDVQSAKENISKVGRDILEEPGALKMGDKTEDIAPKLAIARQKYGSQIGAIGNQIDTAGAKVDGKKIANDILDYAATIPPNEAGKSVQERLLAEASNFQALGDMTFEKAAAMRGNFKFKHEAADTLISNQDATNKIKQIIGSEMDAAAGRVSPQTQEGLRFAKDKYSSFKPAADSSTIASLRELKNRYTSPSDLGVGAAIAVAGAAGSHSGMSLSTLKYVLLGGLATMVHKSVRTTSSSTVARVADQISKTAEASPEFLKRFGGVLADATTRGPAALISSHTLLMRTDPEYKAQIEGQGQ